MTLAYGTMSGNIIFKDRQLKDKGEVSKGAPVWCMEWTPITPDNLETKLCVGCWDQTISFYKSDGTKVGRVK